MENKNIQKITIACFAIIAVWNIVDLFDYFSFQMLLTVIGSILVVIALLTQKTILSAVGFGLMILQGLTDIRALLEGWMPFSIFLIWSLVLARDVLLMVLSIKPKSAKSLGTIAAGICVVRLVVLIIRNIIEGYGFSIGAVIWGILLAASAMLLGLTYDNLSKEVPSIKVSTPIRVVSTEQKTVQTDNVEKLLRLKAFLDEGVLTQEEFDQKKKELLNL